MVIYSQDDLPIDFTIRICVTNEKDLATKIKDWLNDNVGEGNHVRRPMFSPNFLIYHFKRKEDAAVFLLRWKGRVF